MMNRPHFRRTRRPIDPNPEYSRLDRLDGLPGRTRYDAEWPDVRAAEAPPKWADLFGIDPGFTDGATAEEYIAAAAAEPDEPRVTFGYGVGGDPGIWLARADGIDVTGEIASEQPGAADLFARLRAAGIPGGDLAAMAAPADWPTFSGWGEGYEIGPWPETDLRPLIVEQQAFARALAAERRTDALPDLPMVRAAATAYDLGLPVPLRSDPPLYRAALAGHVGVGVGV